MTWQPAIGGRQCRL